MNERTIERTNEWTNGAYPDERHGKGRQTFGGRIDGMGADVYEGDWADGQRCGEGTMQYANGDVFQGCWDEDDKHGEAGPRGLYTPQSRDAPRRNSRLSDRSRPVVRNHVYSAAVHRLM